MDNLKLLLCDDDPGILLVLEKLAQLAGGYTVVGKARNGVELMSLYESLSPQVVIMDIEMPGKTGVECARIIQDSNPRTIIIFATAHQQYMKSAFEVYAFDYLVKPFSNDRVINTLRMARDRLTQPSTGASPAIQPPKGAPQRLMLRHRDGLNFVDLDSIVLVQREDRNTVIYTLDGGRFVMSDTLSELEERLGDGFFRCHKSYIVNISQIDSITPYGRWTHIIKLHGVGQDALITHEKFEELQQMFG